MLPDALLILWAVLVYSWAVCLHCEQICFDNCLVYSLWIMRIKNCCCTRDGCGNFQKKKHFGTKNCPTVGIVIVIDEIWYPLNAKSSVVTRWDHPKYVHNLGHSGFNSFQKNMWRSSCLLFLAPTVGKKTLDNLKSVHLFANQLSEKNTGEEKIGPSFRKPTVGKNVGWRVRQKGILEGNKIIHGILWTPPKKVAHF